MDEECASCGRSMVSGTRVSCGDCREYHQVCQVCLEEAEAGAEADYDLAA